MGESGESNRFEVELTSHDGSTGWERPATEASEADVEVDSAGLPLVLESSPVGHVAGPEWRRIAGVAAIAVAALALGWLLGRSGGSGETSSTEPVADSDETTDTTRAVSDAVAPIAPVEPVTSAPATVPAAAPATVPRSIDETTTAQVALGPAVKGMPIEIVALASGRRVVSLDLSTGTLERTVIDSQPFGPPTLFVGDDWLLLPSWDDDLPSTLVRDGTDPESVDVGPAAQLLSAQGSGVLWRSDLASVGFGAARSESIGLAGKSLGEPLDLPVFPLTADPAGGVVIAVPGGAFQVTTEGSTRITPGRLAAIGPDHAIGHECDGSLVCRYVFIERATGSRSPLPLDIALGEQPFFDTTWGPVSVSAFSPSGAFVVLEWVGVEASFRRTLIVLDVRSGAAVELGVDPGSAQYAWSEDGRVLFYLLGGRLSALDVATGESDLVSDALFGVETFAVRQPSP